MPTSDAEGKTVALDWYRKLRPATVVDIGAGDGTYARLMRAEHRGHWTGVEAWEPYVVEFGLGQLYDQVTAADVRRLPWTAFRADLVIAGDVLEHMSRDDAVAVIRRITYGAANLIVSVPVLHLAQGAVNGNPYERHIHHWSASEMANELVSGLRDQWVGKVLGYFWWSREVTGG